MKKVLKMLPVILALALIISVLPLNTYAATKKPGKTKITKTSVSLQEVTVKYSKAKNAKGYKLYSVTNKTKWKYMKTVKASQKKKYKDAKKYKLKKNGKKYKVYKNWHTLQACLKSRCVL